MPPGPNLNSQYWLGPDSLPQEGVPKGEIRGPYKLPSTAYPGTQHTYWVYVPAQYDPAVPAALMIYRDGQAFKYEEGDLRAQNVMDRSTKSFTNTRFTSANKCATHRLWR